MFHSAFGSAMNAEDTLGKLAPVTAVTNKLFDLHVGLLRLGRDEHRDARLAVWDHSEDLQFSPNREAHRRMSRLAVEHSSVTA
jgi:hypothetical protein